MKKPSTSNSFKTLLNRELFINSSLIDKKCDRDDINVYYTPANDIATKLGTPQVANVVILGAYLERCGVVKQSSIIEGLKKVLGEKKAKFIPLNQKAIEKGGENVR